MSGDQEQHIEMPTNVLLRCPKVGYRMARLGGCAECESFAGLEDKFPGGNMPFAGRYLLKCIHQPVRRELTEIAE